MTEETRPPTPSPMELVVQIASLHRAAEVAQYYWLHDPPPDGEKERSAKTLESASWTRLLDDLHTRLRVLMDVSGTSDALPSLAHVDGVPRRAATPTHDALNDTLSSDLEVHLPHPQWAERYPGAAGDWLSGEIAQRRRLAAAPSDETAFSTQTMMEALVAPCSGAQSDASSSSSSGPSSPGILTDTPAPFAGSSAGVLPAQNDVPMSSRSSLMLGDYFHWRAMHKEPMSRSSSQDRSPLQAPDHDVIQHVLEAATWQAENDIRAEPEPLLRIEPDDPRHAELAPLHDWIDFQATAHAVACLATGTAEQTRMLARLLPSASVTHSPDTSLFSLHMTMHDSRCCLFNVQNRRVNESTSPANLLQNDASSWAAAADGTALMQIQSTVHQDTLGRLPLRHTALAPSHPMRSAIEHWEEHMPRAAHWLPVRAYEPTLGGSDTQDTRLLRHFVRHDYAVAQRLTRSPYTSEQLELAEACVREPGALQHVDALVASRAETYLAKVHDALSPPASYDAQMFTVSRLVLRAAQGYSMQLHGLVFVSPNEITQESLSVYDGMTPADVPEFARRWRLRGPGLDGHGVEERVDAKPPPLLPVAYFSPEHQDGPNALKLSFGRPPSGDGCVHYGGVSGRFLAIKILNTATANTPIKHIAAEGYTGLRTSAQGGFCDRQLL